MTVRLSIKDMLPTYVSQRALVMLESSLHELLAGRVVQLLRPEGSQQPASLFARMGIATQESSEALPLYLGGIPGEEEERVPLIAVADRVGDA